VGVAAAVQAPTDATQKEDWLTGLTDFNYNGCGHVRLQLDPAFTQYFSVVKGAGAPAACDPATNTATCVSAKFIAEKMIRAYFE
jgi:hypothetical protein